jgi:hypothetical protein
MLEVNMRNIIMLRYYQHTGVFEHGMYKEQYLELGRPCILLKKKAGKYSKWFEEY